MRTIAIVQARMSSKRLPGKVLADLGGQPALGLLLDRLGRASLVDQILVATSDDSSDDVIAEFCRARKSAVFRGPLDDVLERYRQAAESVFAEVIVRVTADCPLIDPEIVDGLIHFAQMHKLAYAGLDGDFPHGLDCEVFLRSALDAAARIATDAHDREHVTPYLQRNPADFATRRYAPIAGMREERWTLDYAEDLLFLRRVIEMLGREALIAGYQDVFRTVNSDSDLRAINAVHAARRADPPHGR